VKLWDMRSGKERAALTGHKESITCLRFSANGKWIVTGDTGRIVRLWETETGKEKAVLETRRLKWKQNRDDDVSDVLAAVVSSDGKYVAVECLWEMKVIEVSTGQAKLNCEFDSTMSYRPDFYSESRHGLILAPTTKDWSCPLAV
jgi:WD40 repeat protein